MSCTDREGTGAQGGEIDGAIPVTDCFSMCLYEVSYKTPGTYKEGPGVYLYIFIFRMNNSVQVPVYYVSPHGLYDGRY
jgi:hypothetical protein